MRLRQVTYKIYLLKIELKSQWKDSVIRETEKQYQMNPNKIEAYRDTQSRIFFPYKHD